MDKFMLALSLLRSKSYVLLTDDKAVVSIPVMDLNMFEDILLLGAQTSALNEFRARLDDLINEHEHAVAAFANRKGSKLYAKKGVAKRKS